MSTGAGPGLTVVVTGPTGEIAKPFTAALERSLEVGVVRGMARRALNRSVPRAGTSSVSSSRWSGWNPYAATEEA